MKFSDIKLFFKGYFDNVSKGVCYELGRHVDIDRERALFFYNLAIEDNDPSASLLKPSFANSRHI